MSQGRSNTRFGLTMPTEWMLGGTVSALPGAAAAALTAEFTRCDANPMEYDSEEDAWVPSTAGTLPPTHLARKSSKKTKPRSKTKRRRKKKSAAAAGETAGAAPAADVGAAAADDVGAAAASSNTRKRRRRKKIKKGSGPKRKQVRRSPRK